MIPTERDLADAIEIAARRAIASLFREHPERFYYLSLITTGEAHPPTLAAWSVEALEIAVRRDAYPEKARWDLKWSYAESPYFCYGEDNFGDVRRLFSLRPKISPAMTNEEWNQEYAVRVRAMETAMKCLDQEGIFGVGPERLAIVVNVEVMPPDYTNAERARRLNPPDALTTWMKEAATG
jgi:hypothetical protein